MYKELVELIKTIYRGQHPVPLHAPVFIGNEKKYLLNCIDSGYVSYLGEYVKKLEKQICEYTGSAYAIATVNGTCALQVALEVAGVSRDDEVITQDLTFVATANAILSCGAIPVFVDSDRDTLGMSPDKLEEFLATHCRVTDKGECLNIHSHRLIKACVPVHVFGHPAHIDKIIDICRAYGIKVIEDAAESLGSFRNHQHTGTYGLMGVLSFNGNKIVTTGGGGMILTNDEALANLARHITTTAKVPHPWDFFHDRHGYNYRLNNVSAAIGCAQMENLPLFLERKRAVAAQYQQFFSRYPEVSFFSEPENCYSNYWLNLIFVKNREERDKLLSYTHEQGILTRPVWTLMHKLPMFSHCQTTNLDNAIDMENRGINLPSSVPV